MLRQVKDVNRNLRQELSSSNVIWTPVSPAWFLYSKKRDFILDEQDVPLCKSVLFEVASKGRAVGLGKLSSSYGPDAGEGVPESLITRVGFSTLEVIAQPQADERVVGSCG